MNPTLPEVPEGSRLLVFAKDQPEYISLPAVINSEGDVTTEWEPTAEELKRLLEGGRLKITVKTFDPLIGQRGHYLQPLMISVLEPDCGMRGEG